MQANHLQHLKKVYKQQAVTEQQLQTSWENLLQKLPSQERSEHHFYNNYRFLALGVLIVMIVGTIGVAQASSPGQTLYPVKVATDNTVAKILRKPQIPVDNRATDVIKAANKPKQLHPAITEYQKAVMQSTQQAKNANQEEKNNIKKTLSEQENKLKSVQTTSTADKQLINSAITQTEKAKQEVKGVSTENTNEQNNSEHNTRNKSENNNSNSNSSHQNGGNGNGRGK